MCVFPYIIDKKSQCSVGEPVRYNFNRALLKNLGFGVRELKLELKTLFQVILRLVDL